MAYRQCICASHAHHSCVKILPDGFLTLTHLQLRIRHQLQHPMNSRNPRSSSPAGWVTSFLLVLKWVRSPYLTGLEDCLVLWKFSPKLCFLCHPWIILLTTSYIPLYGWWAKVSIFRSSLSKFSTDSLMPLLKLGRIILCFQLWSFNWMKKSRYDRHNGWIALNKSL